MVTEEKVQELVHRYLEGSLTASELEDFEKQIQDDEDFAQQVEDYTLLVQGLHALGLESFEKKVGQWEMKHQAGKKEAISRVVSMRPMRRYYAAAAVILMLIIPIGYWLVSQDNNYSNQELYAQNFEPYTDVITERGPAGLLEVGMGRYSAGEYGEAIRILNEYSSTIPADSNKNEYAIYLGIAYMETGQAEEALSNFNLAIQDKRFKQQAEWYKALAFLKAEEIGKAQILLKKIASEEHYQKAQATKLLKEIE